MLVLALVAGLSVAAVLWLALRPGAYVAPTPDPVVRGARPAEAARTLQRLEAAVTARDPDRAEELAAAGDDAAATLLRDILGNARKLRVRDFDLRYVSELGGPDADGTWPAAVDVTWRFGGFDREPARQELQVRFAVDAETGTVGIADFGGGGRRSPLWLDGPLEVRRTDRTLVLAADGAAADRYAAAARRAVPVVRRVLPEWGAGLVVEVPGSEADLDAALGAAAGTYADIAALAATVDGTRAPDSPVHVFVNPRVYGGLQRTGAQVVMSHEAAHVASGAAFSPAPLWLLEGFADYVALRDVDLPLTTTAGQILEQVRTEGLPERLPAGREFEATDAHLGAAYESAWLACRLLAQRGGEDALVAFYRDVDGGTRLEQALGDRFGLDVAELTRLWRESLSSLTVVGPAA